MATIKDVAKLAGVSISTVSLVLNSSSAVKHETRYRVMCAIEELGYKPNPSARSLVTKEKKVIAAIKLTNDIKEIGYSFDTVVDTYLSEMLKSIEVEAFRADYSLLLDEMLASGEDSPQLPSVFDKNRIDGAIFAGGMIHEELAAKLTTAGVPAVLVGSRHEALDYVDTDPEYGICAMTEYLINNGHRDIVFVNGPDISQSTDRKLSGYKKALCKNHLAYRPEWVMQTDFTGQGGYDCFKTMWEMGIRPTAVLGSADCVSLGIMRYIYEIGLACPADISVVGFEDGILAEYAVPPLTTVCVHKPRLGAEACRVLLNRINNPKAKLVKLIIKPELRIRSSVRRLE